MTPNYYYHNSITNEDYAGLFKIEDYKITTVPASESNYTDIVLTLKGNIIISKGNGTYDNPYIINGGA